MEGVSRSLIENALSQHSEMMMRIAFNYVKNKQDAEDIVQDVLLILIKKSPTFTDDAHLKRWLIRVTINESKSRLKAIKKGRESISDFTGEAYTDGAYPSGVMDEVMKLPETDRAAVYLFYMEGYSAKEIAKILGKSENSVFMRLTRARKKLNLLSKVKRKS